MTEERKRVWDATLGVVTPLVTITALLLGVWQFNRGEENKTRLESQLQSNRDTQEYRRKLFEERLSVYRTVADLAGRIAAHENKDKKLEELIESFIAQYWGLVVLTEDKEVEKSMIRFHDEILDYRKNVSDSTRVRIRADELVKACRLSLQEQRSVAGL
jgi:hypothetical protein